MSKYAFGALLALSMTGSACGPAEEEIPVGRLASGLIDAQGTDEAEAEAKCLGWGYAAPDYLEVCIRMVRADYCGDGKSHTFNGTRIKIYDKIPIHAPGPATPGFKVEAVWQLGGGARGSALCLSKWRWDMLPASGPGCPDVLPDPRVDDEGEFCDDKTWNQWSGMAAVRLGNDSAELGKGLYTWRKNLGGTTRHYTSARYLWDGMGSTPPPATWGNSPDFEGVVFTGVPPAVYPSLTDPAYTVNLLECTSVTNPNDRLTTTVAPGGYNCQWAESARIFAPSIDPTDLESIPKDIQPFFTHGQARQLRSYRRPATGDNITTTAEVAPPGYVRIRIEGWVINLP